MGARPANHLSVGLPRHPWEHPFFSDEVAPRLLKNLRRTQRNKLSGLRIEHGNGLGVEVRALSVFHPWPKIVFESFGSFVVICNLVVRLKRKGRAGFDPCSIRG